MSTAARTWWANWVTATRLRTAFPRLWGSCTESPSGKSLVVTSSRLVWQVSSATAKAGHLPTLEPTLRFGLAWNVSPLLVPQPGYYWRPVFKPWPSGTPQLKPTRAKLQNPNLHRWVAKRYRRASSQESHSIVWLRPRSHLTTTKQLGSSWPRWPNGGILGSSWANIWAWSNSSQLKPSGWPNDTQLHRSWELGSSWLELAVPFGQGFSQYAYVLRLYQNIEERFCARFWQKRIE